MSDDGDLRGGSIAILWPYSAAATLDVTNGGVVTSGGVPQVFPQILSGDTVLDFPNNCTPTVTVTLSGVTLLNKTLNIQWSQEATVDPDTTWDAGTLVDISNNLVASENLDARIGAALDDQFSLGNSHGRAVLDEVYAHEDSDGNLVIGSVLVPGARIQFMVQADYDALSVKSPNTIYPTL